MEKEVGVGMKLKGERGEVTHGICSEGWTMGRPSLAMVDAAS